MTQFSKRLEFCSWPKAEVIDPDIFADLSSAFWLKAAIIMRRASLAASDPLRPLASPQICLNSSVQRNTIQLSIIPRFSAENLPHLVKWGRWILCVIEFLINCHFIGGSRPYVQHRQSHSNGPKLNLLSHHRLASICAGSSARTINKPAVGNTVPYSPSPH
jgi:hypothetical protein